MPRSKSKSKRGRKPPGDRRVAKVLRQVRIDAKLTQRALGLLIRRPQSWVWNCENGRRRVNVVEFIAWCRACNADPMNGFDSVLEAIA